MQIEANREFVRIILDNGYEFEVRPYSPGYVGHAGGLADGATHTFDDGCTVTRQGDQEVWHTPAKLR